jgi:hypothetical protein
MPLTINLLHEEQALVKQRKRDPLKLGLYALGGVAALFVAYYAYRLIGSSEISGELKARQAEWARQAPKEDAAEAQDKIFNEKLSVANLVSQRIDNRFYWAPLLAHLQRTVTPNVQIIRFSGSSDPKDEKVTISLDGLAAGPVPRAAAEQFRTTLNDTLGRSYKGAAATFLSLDETASSVTLNSKQMPTARFTIEVKLDRAASLPVLAATPARRANHS